MYSVLEELDADELITIRSDGGWKRSYALTPEGQQQGEKLLGMLTEQAQEYVRCASDFVRSLDFSQLVSAIYKAYPDMRENSIIRST